MASRSIGPPHFGGTNGRGGQTSMVRASIGPLCECRLGLDVLRDDVIATVAVRLRIFAHRAGDTSGRSRRHLTIRIAAMPRTTPSWNTGVGRVPKRLITYCQSVLYRCTMGKYWTLNGPRTRPADLPAPTDRCTPLDGDLDGAADVSKAFVRDRPAREQR